MTDNHPSNTISTRKQTIAQHFAKAQHYNEHAIIQQKTCQQLLTKITQKNQRNVLEIGAGTGQMTQLLAKYINSQSWLINELSNKQANTLHKILPEAKIVIGDAESLFLNTEILNSHNIAKNNHQNSNFSLIISANAVQWFDHPLGFIKQSFNQLADGGQLLFNTFTPDNFYQIKQLTGQGLTYPTTEDWQKELEQAGFKHIDLSIHRYTLNFSSPYEVLKHMKLTGVSTNLTAKQTSIQVTQKTINQSTSQPHTSSQQPFTWTKTRLKTFETAYWQQFSSTDERGKPCVYLTYDVLIISAFKPS